VIESINQTLKGQRSLEDHGGRTLAGVFTRVAQRGGVSVPGITRRRDQPGDTAAVPAATTITRDRKTDAYAVRLLPAVTPPGQDPPSR
jgi:hypothetical protein